MRIVYQNVFLRHAILAQLHHFQAETFLHEAIFIILSKQQWFAMLYIDGMLFTSVFGVNWFVSTVIEDYTVLQNLAERRTFVLVSSLKNLNSMRRIVGNRTRKEPSAGAKA